MMFTPKKLAFKISDAKRKQKIECCAYGCKSKPNEKKLGLCHKHYHIYRRQKDPVYDRYVNFKGNAKKRPWNGQIGIPFEVTLEEFRKFCNDTGYIIKKGMRGRNCMIDRIRNWEGYYIENMQLLTIYKNIEKYNLVNKNHEDYTPF